MSARVVSHSDGDPVTNDASPSNDASPPTKNTTGEKNTTSGGAVDTSSMASPEGKGGLFRKNTPSSPSKSILPKAITNLPGNVNEASTNLPENMSNLPGNLSDAVTDLPGNSNDAFAYGVTPIENNLDIDSWKELVALQLNISVKIIPDRSVELMGKGVWDSFDKNYVEPKNHVEPRKSARNTTTTTAPGGRGTTGSTHEEDAEVGEDDVNAGEHPLQEGNARHTTTHSKGRKDAQEEEEFARPAGLYILSVLFVGSIPMVLVFVVAALPFSDYPALTCSESDGDSRKNCSLGQRSVWCMFVITTLLAAIWPVFCFDSAGLTPENLRWIFLRQIIPINLFSILIVEFLVRGVLFDVTDVEDISSTSSTTSSSPPSSTSISTITTSKTPTNTNSAVHYTSFGRRITPEDEYLAGIVPIFCAIGFATRWSEFSAKLIGVEEWKELSIGIKILRGGGDRKRMFLRSIGFVMLTGLSFEAVFFGIMFDMTFLRFKTEWFWILIRPCIFLCLKRGLWLVESSFFQVSGLVYPQARHYMPSHMFALMGLYSIVHLGFTSNWSGFILAMGGDWVSFWIQIFAYSDWGENVAGVHSFHLKRSDRKSNSDSKLSYARCSLSSFGNLIMRSPREQRSVSSIAAAGSGTVAMFQQPVEQISIGNRVTTTSTSSNEAPSQAPGGARVTGDPSQGSGGAGEQLAGQLTDAPSRIIGQPTGTENTMVDSTALKEEKKPWQNSQEAEDSKETEKNAESDSLSDREMASIHSRKWILFYAFAYRLVRLTQWFRRWIEQYRMKAVGNQDDKVVRGWCIINESLWANFSYVVAMEIYVLIVIVDTITGDNVMYPSSEYSSDQVDKSDADNVMSSSKSSPATSANTTSTSPLVILKWLFFRNPELNLAFVVIGIANGLLQEYVCRTYVMRTAKCEYKRHLGVANWTSHFWFLVAGYSAMIVIIPSLVHFGKIARQAEMEREMGR